MWSGPRLALQRRPGAAVQFSVGDRSGRRAEIKATFSRPLEAARIGALRGSPLSRLWSEIQRRFDRDDDLSDRDVTL